MALWQILKKLNDDHRDSFNTNTKQKSRWDIVQTASFVLDIADEEFRQEKKYDKKELIKAMPPQMHKQT